jgi:hypothetical protein
MRGRLLICAALGLVPAILLAQAESRPSFDVVSIKPNRTNQGIPLVVFQPGGRMIAANVNIRQVILVAYGIDNLQLVGAPTGRQASASRSRQGRPIRRRRTPFV